MASSSYFLIIGRACIGQVVGILLDNAMVHTSSGGRIIVTAVAKDVVVRVSVEDTGTGIPPDEIKRIFARFHRVHPSRIRSTGGAGLGLTIAKQMVDATAGRYRRRVRGKRRRALGSRCAPLA
jgi:two-component system sensor histidine kinase BaeS